MGQATPIRVKRVLKVERVEEDDVHITWLVDADDPEHLVMVMDIPTLRESVPILGAIVTFQ